MYRKRMVPVDIDFATEPRTHGDPKDSNSLSDNLRNMKLGLLSRWFNLIYFSETSILVGLEYSWSPSDYIELIA